MDVKDAIKKYWPWVLGAVVALFIISRLRTSGSGSNAGYAQAMGQMQQAASANAAQAAQIRAQAEHNQALLAAQEIAANRAHELATKKIDYEYELGMHYSDLQSYIADEQQRTERTAIGAQREVALHAATLNAQSSMYAADAAAGAAAISGYANIISALYEPGIAAINASAAENVATITAAGNIVAAGYNAQAEVLSSGLLASAYAAGMGISAPIDALWAVASGLYDTSQSQAAMVANQNTTQISGGYGPFYGSVGG